MIKRCRHTSLLMRQGSTQRWIAILFLLFASAEISADVIAPELCCEELRGLVNTIIPDTATLAISQDDEAPIGEVNNSNREKPSGPVSTEEECFCCCAHILPSLHFEVAKLDVEPLTSGLANTILPIAPPQIPYHPPRLS